MNVASLVRLVAGSVYKCVFLCVIERFNFFITQLLQLKYKHFVVVVIVKHFCSQASSVEGTNKSTSFSEVFITHFLDI